MKHLSGPYRFLVVDDNPEDCEICEHLLSKTCVCSVRFAYQGYEALKLMKDQEFDCVLLDYSLPGENGIEVLEQILKQDENMAVIMLTGLGSEEVAVRAMKAGAMDYLPKDGLNSASLYRSVDNAIKRTSLQKKVSHQREELESFARILVHDLRLPVDAMHGLLEEIKFNLGDQCTGLVDEYITDAMGAARHMNDLIEALYRYTQLDREETVFEPTSMGLVIDGVLTNLRSLVKKVDAKIQVEDLPRIKGDATQLTQLFQNLVSNALVYGGDDALVITIKARTGKDEIVISVSDNGKGIDPDKLESIFEPFKRFSGGEFNEMGAGLGLATCRKIAQRHGGRIWCESEPGAGSVFNVAFPLHLGVGAKEVSRKEPGFVGFGLESHDETESNVPVPQGGIAS